MIRNLKQLTWGNTCFVLALILLVSIFGYSLVNLTNTEGNANWVSHTYQMKLQIEQVFSLVKDAERAQRGYLITQEPMYLGRFKAAAHNEGESLKALQLLIRDNSPQQQNLEKLDQLSQQRILFLEHVIQAQNHAGIEAARQWVLTGRGDQLMQAIQNQVQVMNGEEDRLLAIRQKQFMSYKRRVLNFLILIFGFAMLILIGAFSFFNAANQSVGKLLSEKKKYAHQLEQSNQDLAQVAVIASHDLKAPLRKIRFFMDEILKDSSNTLSEQSLDLFQRMQVSAEKLQCLIEHILDLSRRKEGNLPIEPINLTQLVQEVVITLEEKIDETNGRVEVGSLCQLNADKTEMVQLLQNLVDNGLKYHRSGVPPVVSISAQPTQDGGCEIRVKDNGIGIERQHQEEIFQMFKRLPSTHGYSGNGVGLGIVKKIVTHHQGSISVMSTLGQGSEFIVKLPSLET